MTIKQPVRHIIILLIIYIAFSNSLRAEVNDNTVEFPVIKLQNALLTLMKEPKKFNFKERYKNIEPIIKSLFNNTLISKVILGRHWKTLNDEEKIEFIGLIERLTISNYAKNFRSFSGEEFNIISILPMKKNRFMVKTELSYKQNNEIVTFDYIVQKDNEKWKIISVIANGINDLSIKRAEYAATIKNKSYKLLITNLKNKLDMLAN